MIFVQPFNEEKYTNSRKRSETVELKSWNIWYRAWRYYLFLVASFLFFYVQPIFLLELWEVKMFFCLYRSFFRIPTSLRVRTVMWLRFPHGIFICFFLHSFCFDWILESSIGKNFLQLFWVESINKIIQNFTILTKAYLFYLELNLFWLTFVLKIRGAFSLEVLSAIVQSFCQISILTFEAWNCQLSCIVFPLKSVVPNLGHVKQFIEDLALIAALLTRW